MPIDALAGRRILLVEDELMIALMVESHLQSLGCVVVGPAGKLDQAVRLATSEALDAAILDVTIRGGAVYPAADVLRVRGIPFVLASGYGTWALPAAHRDQPRLTKPFTLGELERQLRVMCGAVSAVSPAA